MRLYFNWIWQWNWKHIFYFTPFLLEFEYDKWNPSIGIDLTICNVGFSATLFVPWTTKESKKVEEGRFNIQEFINGRKMPLV